VVAAGAEGLREDYQAGPGNGRIQRHDPRRARRGASAPSASGERGDLHHQGKGAHPQTGAYGPGDYVSERKGAIHDELPFDEETELLMICNGPSGFLGPKDEIRYLMDIPMLQELSKYAPARA